MKASTKNWLMAGVAGLVVVGATVDAFAAGFMLREQSSEYLGDSYAGSAAKAQSPATIWYNPAGMTLLDGNQIAGSLTWIAPQSRFSGSGAYTGQNSRDVIDDAAIGSTFAMYSFSKDLKFGLAVTAPFGLRSSYPATWGMLGGVVPVGSYHGVAAAVTNINVNPNVAYRINQNLSIGGGIQVAWTQADLSLLTPAPPTGVGLARIKVDDTGVGWNVGALWEFSPTSRVGVAYRSAIRNGLTGDMTSLTYGSLIPAMRVHADLTLPGTATFSVYHEIDDKWAVMADAQWTNWASLKDLTVYNAAGAALESFDYSWRDTWFFSVGVDYKWTKGHTLHFGAAYDMGAVKDAAHREVLVPDSDRYWLSTGYTWEVNDHLRWNLAYAHLFSPEADISTTAQKKLPTLTGSYNSSVDMISTSFVYKF